MCLRTRLLSSGLSDSSCKVPLSGVGDSAQAQQPRSGRGELTAALGGREERGWLRGTQGPRFPYASALPGPAACWTRLASRRSCLPFTARLPTLISAGATRGPGLQL